METDGMPAPGEESDHYSVDRLPAVTAEIRRIFERAKGIGLADQVLDALAAIVEALETRPLEWGDPEYATKKEGGLVLHGILSPFIVQYVTFHAQRVVCILKLRIIPGHPLATQ